MGQIKNNIGDDSFLEYTDSRTSIVSGETSISAIKGEGAFINGSLSISSKPTNIRIGAMYTFHPLTLLGIPSNDITPIPIFKIDIPVYGVKMASKIVSSLRGIL